MTAQIEVKSVKELVKTLPKVLESLRKRHTIALYGEMGAGKTTFVKAFCRHFAVQENTASPTFSLVNEYTYQLGDGRPGKIFHLDLYRLKNLQEALDIGIEDLLYDSTDYCLIEWPQVIEPLLPEDTARIEICIIGDSQRLIKIT